MSRMKGSVRASGVGMSLALAMAVAGCATPGTGTLDPVVKTLSGSAGAAYQRGELDRAAELYRQARQRARLIDDPGEVARNTYNLALCRMTAGGLDEAASLLAQAAALTGNQGGDASRILLAQAEVSRLSGDKATSARLAREALSAGVDREGRVQSLLLQGEAAAPGDGAEAVKHFKAASSGVTDRTPALIRARLDALAARLIREKRIPGDPAARQASRAQWLKKAGQYGMMVQALDEAAACYEQDSRWSEAFRCRIGATHSLLAAGDKVSSRAMLRKAADLAERSGDVRNKALVVGLAGEIQ